MSFRGELIPPSTQKNQFGVLAIFMISVKMTALESGRLTESKKVSQKH